MNKKNKVIIASLLLYIFFHTITFATWSRISSLGVPFWMIKEDDTLIWLNPYEIVNYPNQVWTELGTAGGSNGAPNVNGNLSINNQWGGISAKTDFVFPGTMGLFFGRPYWGLVSSAGQQTTGSDVTSVENSPLGTSMLPLQLYNKFDIFFGSNKIFQIPLGMSLSYASNSSYKTESSVTKPTTVINDVKYTEELNSSEIWLMLGTKLTNFYIFNSFEAILNLGIHNVNNKYIDELYNGEKFVVNDNYSFVTKGFLTPEVTLRGIYEKNKNVSIITLFDYYRTNLSNEFIRKTDTNLDNQFVSTDRDVYYKREQKYVRSFLTIGAATNVYFSPKILFIIGTNIFVDYTNIEEKREQMLLDRKGIDQEYKYEYNRINTPVYLACEYNITNFLTLSSGINKVVLSIVNNKIVDPDYGGWNGSQYPLVNIIETETKNDSSSGYTTNVSFGARLKIKNKVLFDLVVRQNVLFTGTYIISGVPETLFSQITAIYKF